ncbi:MAG: hypothetical protein J6334_12110 [Kiritimatiellae bacterium]|nr:hypothetical protein [Kiritimatiellia bacterium]
MKSRSICLTKSETGPLPARKVALAAGVAVMLPLVAKADAGTPLLWVGGIHLLIGNFIIGIIEGRLLECFSPKRKGWTCMLLMIAANYLSAWLGVVLSSCCGPLFDRAGIEHVKAVFGCAVAASYLITLIVEAPFVWLAFFGSDQCAKRVVMASLFVQSISYVALFGIYALVSETSLFAVQVVDPGTMNLPDDILISYVGNDGKGYVGGLCSRSWRETDPDPVRNAWADVDLHLPVRVVGDAKSDWFARVGCFPGQGLWCRLDKMGPTFRLAFETPVMRWTVREATQLPDGKVVFRLGGDQICIVDPTSKQIAMLARGRYPTLKSVAP